MRTFYNFPANSKCPICGTSDNKPCVLVPIDRTEQGNLCKAEPVHVDCLTNDEWRYNRDVGIIYIFCRREE